MPAPREGRPLEGNSIIAEGATPHFVFLALYLFILVGVGALKARKVKTQSDFSLAGRGLSSFVLIGTLLATWIGTGSIFGNAQETARVGLGGFVLPVAGASGVLVLWLLAARIRSFGQFTIQDILEARFGVGARVLGTVTLLFAYVIIVSYQLRAGSAVLSYLFTDLDPAWAKVWVAFFVVVYTALAGLFSVAYTDVANGILMTLGIFLAIPVLLSETGGFGAALAALPEDHRTLFGHYDATALIGVLLPPLLLIVGDANMYQRFFAARSPREARRSAAGLFVGVLLLEWAIITVAFLGTALIASGKVSTPENSGHVIVHLAFHVLPPWLGALMVGTVVAIIVSTADSYLLSPATSLVRDVYQRFLEPDADDARVVLVGRLVVCGLGLVALGLAFTSDEFFRVALFAYTIYGAGITPVLLAAFFWRRATRAGALASMVTGVGVAFLWQLVTLDTAREWASAHGWTTVVALGDWCTATGLDPVLPAVLLSVLVLVGVSLATPRPSDEVARAI